MINPYLSCWTQEIIPLPEINEFYNLESVKVPDDRPYTWGMTVSSLDGIISFKEAGHEGPEEIALKHIPNSGGGADWRLLNAGWMFADAVLGTGSILRSEPHVKFLPNFEDLVTHRTNVLKKKTKYPINLILTASGDIDLDHVIFHDQDLEVVILTTKKGEVALRARNKDKIFPSNTKVEIAESEDGNSVEFSKAFYLLRTKYNIKYLDVTAGGATLSMLYKHKMIDECRLTISGQLCGGLSTKGEQRPTVFTLPSDMHFTHVNNPIIDYYGIRAFGKHFLFIRGGVIYRH